MKIFFYLLSLLNEQTKVLIGGSYEEDSNGVFTWSV